MFTSYFWKKTAEVAIRTFATTLIGAGIAIGSSAVEWRTALTAAGIATVLSIIAAVATINVGPEGTPSVIGKPDATPEVPEYGTYLAPDENTIPHPGDNFDTNDFGPPVIDPKDVQSWPSTSRSRLPGCCPMLGMSRMVTATRPGRIVGASQAVHGAGCTSSPASKPVAEPSTTPVVLLPTPS